MMQDREAGQIWIGHPSYCEDVLKKLTMENLKLINIPAACSMKLVKITENYETVNKELCQSAVGS